MREVILKKLAESDDLPTLPEIILRLEKKIADPETGLNDIAKLIESDAVLSGKILKVANSVYYSGGRVEIKTIPMAVIKLGLKEIRDLTYSLNLTKLFVDNTILDTHQFWLHSLAVGLFARLIGEHLGMSKETQELSFLSGLMHDVGIMVFTYLIPDKYMKFLKKSSTQEIPLEKLELQDFLIDHPELGAYFIEKWWKVDTDVILAVRQHHFPFEGNSLQRKCSQLVNIANGICNNQGIPNGTNCYSEVFKEGAWLELGLSLEKSDIIFEDVKSSLEEAETLLTS